MWGPWVEMACSHCLRRLGQVPAQAAPPVHGSRALSIPTETEQRERAWGEKRAEMEGREHGRWTAAGQGYAGSVLAGGGGRRGKRRLAGPECHGGGACPESRAAASRRSAPARSRPGGRARSLVTGGVGLQ